MRGLGLRKLDVMNQACLIKLGWKLQSGGEEYWCSVLRGKYNGNIGQNRRAESGVGPNLWNALNDIKPMLDRFSYWHVGNGCDTWIEEGLCLDQHINIPIVLPPHVDNGRDERVGVGGNKKDFSVTSMYNNLRGFNKYDAHYMWCKVWKLKAPERVRTFIWLVMHNKLLTNSLKSVTGLSHAMCSYCRVVEETTLHVLRDCTLAKEIWGPAVPVASRRNWNAFWAMACYLLWNWRNKELHVRPNRPVHQVKKMAAADYIHVMQNNNIMVNRTQVASMVGWVPPKDDFIKLNTDGASKKMQLAGCGDRRGCSWQPMEVDSLQENSNLVTTKNGHKVGKTATK
ncbi:RNA-directed DNA polymerase (reverse transcriptase) [Trifolium pratense]|uniref:RNA-directed DNA polymerase (Reverse transcriptase) n=1 Tax=Trifolium pratense TaxID=57577 RepID=A0A2K3LL11_TRIPR|nr:RNA-directed DNA polymerase (reverse transcriptase) [Trifolium pratense]